LKKEPKITKLHGNQYLEFWKDEISLSDNGFVQSFSISRNAGGTLYFNKDDFNCESFGVYYIKFSKEKIKEFQFAENRIFVYTQHNIDLSRSIILEKLGNYVYK